MQLISSSAIGPAEITEGHRKGASVGALICAIGGSSGMLCVFAYARPAPAWYWFAAVTAPAIAMLAWAIAEFRIGRRLAYSADDLQRFQPLRKFYFLDTGMEWGLCALAGFFLWRWGRFDLMPQCIGLIVGLHFLPLGKLFRVPIYYGMGGVMAAAEMASLLMARSDTRSIVGCVALGLPLWITALIILRTLSAASPAGSGCMNRPKRTSAPEFMSSWQPFWR